jgi:hypothetical protein
MGTSDERREVAERMRELAARTPRDGWMTISQNARFIEERDYALGIQSMGRRETVQRIADLIDPTCEVDSIEPVEDELGQTVGYEFHLTCGHSVMRPYMDMPPAYCGECGCRVVGGDGR